ncbi:uncharacterized protein BDW43DRAFT_304283 [Aspergillus alliaceus]|uniref:uncharacterized protein n=1 Tax=Petromyces alliaceus TaxID=209559 RepID=UPI0012A5EB07|nr:uncharacterized protein BDW43DRAFT_304283 [Aspergillus alliaceus]KAB8227894.1 hypothetical protein BDW43DRAFT_304283 [Aspergillus alliaceus]
MPSSTDSEHVSPGRLGCRLTFEFSGTSVGNRFLKSSMGERMASFSEADISRRGIPSVELVNLYRHWGEGNIGLIITGNVMINCAHLVSAGDTIIPVDAPLEGLRFDRFSDIALEAKRHGSLVIAQLCHPGRGNFGTDFGKSRPATKEDIEHIVKGFAHAAAYAESAGFDGIQLQSAHGHLLSQFLSPRTNKRQDSYGDNMKNRMRLISEIREPISEQVAKDFIVGIKVNIVEFQESAFGFEEADPLSIALEQKCFDFVELSGGTYEDWTMHRKHIASIQQSEAIFLEIAKLYSRRMNHTRIYVTGRLRSIRGMVRALDKVDGIGLARPLCQEPHLCSQLLTGGVTSASAIKIDMNDFHHTSVTALIQVKHMGRGLQPIDLGSKKDVDRLYKAIIEHERTRFRVSAPVPILRGDAKPVLVQLK